MRTRALVFLMPVALLLSTVSACKSSDEPPAPTEAATAVQSVAQTPTEAVARAAEPTAVPAEEPKQAATAELMAFPTPTLTDAQDWAVVVKNIAQALTKVEQPESGVAAVVNGQEITTSRLLQGIIVRLYTTPEEMWTDWFDSANDPTLEYIAVQTLEQLINMEILLQQARTAGLSPSAEEIADEREYLRTTLLEMMPHDGWDALTEETGITLDTLELMAEQSLVLGIMVDAHAEIEDVEQVHAAHILVAEEDEAQDLVDKLAAGEVFGELAKVHSVDRSNADKGGDLGWFPRGVMVEAFEKAAFALEVGMMSDPVQTNYGYHLIHVIAREIRPLENQYADQAKFDVFNDWFMATRDAAEIVRTVYNTEP